MTAALLMGPLVVVGASVILFATTLLERLIASPQPDESGEQPSQPPPNQK